DLASRQGFLVIVEGESDCWSLWHHTLPALGVPGSNASGVIASEFLEGVERAYIHREPDQGGATFVVGEVKRLQAIGYRGEVYELGMPNGVKDPSDLHVADPAGFVRGIGLALRDAARLDLVDGKRKAPSGASVGIVGRKTRYRPLPAFRPFPLAA